MRRHNLLWVPLALICQIAVASDRISDAVLGVLEGFKQQHLEAERARIIDLHGSYLSSGAERDRKLMSLALGVHYLESDHKLADQYLSDAIKATDVGDPLMPIIKFFLAQAKLKSGAYEDSVGLLEGLLLDQPNDAWRKAILGFLIENHFAAGNYEQLAKKFRQFSDSYTFGRRQESLARIAINAYEKRGDYANALEVLEELARSYPTTEDSRWAFQRLIDYTCEVKNRNIYYFSDELLTAISRNMGIDDGIKDLVVSLVSGKIRFEKHLPRFLTPSERAELFFRLRFYDNAAREYEILYKDAVDRVDLKDRAHFAFQAGRSYFRQLNNLKSAEWFSRFIVENKQNKLLHKAYELLGDSLKYLGFPSQASEQFTRSLAIKKDKLVQWERFWSTYRSGDYRAALSQLEGNGAVTIRPADEPHVVTYWHGRILEKLGRKREALAKYSEILSSSGDSFYANLVAAQYPNLVDVRPRSTNQIESDQQGKLSHKNLLSARALPKSGVFSDSNAFVRPELKVVDDLLRVGLKNVAAMQLASIRWGDYNQEEAFSAVSRLAWVLEDYQPNRRIRSFNFSPLRNLPVSFAEFVSHQIRNTDDWKIYYPIAFESIVNSIAKSAEVDRFLILSIMRAESFYNKEARSSVGALGLMQLMPYTAVRVAATLKDVEFDVNDLLKPEINISYGGYYLGKLVRYYNGNQYVAAAAYNAGPTVVNHWLQGCQRCSTEEFVETIPYRETRRYVREVMKTFAHYQRVYLDRLLPLQMPALPDNLPSEEIF